MKHETKTHGRASTDQPPNPAIRNNNF